MTIEEFMTIPTQMIDGDRPLPRGYSTAHELIIPTPRTLFDDLVHPQQMSYDE